MAFRKFNNIQYPVPGVDTAIQTLRPGARWHMASTTFLEWEDDEGREPPTWEEIQAEIEREKVIYDYYLYERKRERKYPNVKDQLDMLYHDIKSGNLNNGTWINTIDKVKTTCPKPEGPKPKV